jgi:hypothetical protein
MPSHDVPSAARRRRRAAAAMLALAALSCIGAASAARDGTIFDDRVFEWRHYIDPSVNADLQNAGITSEATARWHWQTYGINEGRRGSPGFYSREYLAAYADLRNAYGATNWSGAITHYLAHGYTEARLSQSTCPVNYDLSTNGANVPRYCYARSLNATITSTDQYFAKYLYCFPLPAAGRNVSGLSGSITINTTTIYDKPSEALVIVGRTPNDCPANGTKYADWNIAPLAGSTTLASFIAKRQGQGSVTVGTNVDFPAVATGGGNLYVLLDGGPSLNYDPQPITSISMKSNIALKTAASAYASKYFLNGSDEYCYLMTGGCQAASTSGNVTFVTAQRAPGGASSVRLFGNTSAGSITRPTGAWTSRHDWYVAPCTVVGMPANQSRWVYSVPGRAPVPGVPSYGYEQTSSGDSQHTTVNTLLPLPATGVRAGTDCIVHLAYANVNSQMDIESQVNYMFYY